MNKIPWKRLLVEGLVIVISILLAFGIEAWWQDRQEKAQEIELLKAIRQDFVENQQRIVDQVASINTALDYLVAFTTSNDIDRFIADLDSNVELIVAPMYRSYTTSGIMLGFLESTTNSGMLALISSSDLRGAIAEIVNQKDNLEVIADDIRSLTDQSMIELGKYPESLRPNWDESFSYSDSDGKFLRDLHSNSQLMALSNAKLQRFQAYTRNLLRIQIELQEVADFIEIEIGQL